MEKANRSVNTYATLRILGDSLLPSQITSILGIEPTESHMSGDRRGKSGIWNSGYWELSSKESVASGDLSDHIDWLISQLIPKIDEINQIKAISERMDIFCFLGCDIGNCAISLPYHLIKALSTVELDLDIDIYI